MKAPETTLAALNSFGDVAAEDDAVLDYFLSTNAVESIEKNQVFLVLGRKGTGKTALVRYFSERLKSGTSRSLSLRGYPWTVHARRVDRGASEIEAYVSSWRYLIAVELASLVLAQPRSTTAIKSEVLRTFLSENYGGHNPDLNVILQPARLKVGKFTFSPAILGNQIGGVELERSAGDYNFGFELNALSTAIINAAHEVAKFIGVNNLSLHFDELDQGLDRLDDERRRMLIGLVLAAREIRRESSNAGLSVNPVIYLRTDIWEEMNFSDKNKISHTATLNLNWRSEDLQRLVDERLRARLGEGVSWDRVSSSDLMRGSQSKWNHVLARTFNRPRDVIQFLNIALDEAKRRDPISTVIINEDIVSSRDAYSSYLKKELDDEIGPHWPYWEDALQACSGIRTLTFERHDFIGQYNRRRNRENPIEADKALELMHRFSVVGYERRSGYGGSSWSFRYSDPTAGWDDAATRFKVHLGLKEFAKLREVRTVV